jgi:hypothetical protein
MKDLVDYYLDHGIFTPEQKKDINHHLFKKMKTGSAYEAICINLEFRKIH